MDQILYSSENSMTIVLPDYLTIHKKNVDNKISLTCQSSLPGGLESYQER